MIRYFLLADDDEDDRALFAEALKEIDNRIDCHCVRGGKDVVQQLKAGHSAAPHIIFLDINMPGMNGWECLVELKAIGSDVPIVMYSTSCSPEEAARARKLGAVAFYEKPSSFMQLKNFLALIANTPADHLRTVLAKVEESKLHKVFV